MSGLDRRLAAVTVEVACDVTNPLCGPLGASRIFGPQKGATPEMALALDDHLRHYAAVVQAELGLAYMQTPGAGAAGGMGFGLMAFLGGRLARGIDLVIAYSGLEEKVRQADMVWTGEGSLDAQTAFGKTPLGVALVAKKHGKPVVALAGRVGADIEGLYSQGIDAIFGIVSGVNTLDEALAAGPANIERTAANVVRFMYAVKPLVTG
jgi:glycerate kinase